MRRSDLRTHGFRRLVVAWTFSNFGDNARYLTLAPNVFAFSRRCLVADTCDGLTRPLEKHEPRDRRHPTSTHAAGRSVDSRRTVGQPPSVPPTASAALRPNRDTRLNLPSVRDR